MFKEKLSLIIPTKDRPKEIARLLESISLQEVRPHEIVVVDAGEHSLEGLLENFQDLKINYVRSDTASLTLQRNLGLKKIKSESTLIAFFDDDIVLERGALGKMMHFWDGASADTQGAGFNLINIPYRKTTFLEKLFLVNPEKPGIVLRSGFQSKNHCVKKDMSAGWLSGGSMVWRKGLFREFLFDEWFSGYAHCEDLDFSYRVGKKYKMFIVADAKARHLSERLDNSEKLDFSFSLGKMQVLNRLYFVSKNKGLSLAFAYWACLGILISNLTSCLSRREKRYVLRSEGNIAGLFTSFFKKNKGVKE